MVKSEMGLDMDLSFFDEPAPPMDDGGEAGKTLTESQESLLTGKTLKVAGVPMDARYLESLKSHIDDEASKTLDSLSVEGQEAEEVPQASNLRRAEPGPISLLTRTRASLAVPRQVCYSHVRASPWTALAGRCRGGGRVGPRR